MSNSKKVKASIFLRLAPRERYKVLKSLPEDEAVTLLSALDPSDATGVLRFFKPDKRSQIIEKMSDNIKEQLSLLLKFDERTAGGLMNLNYVQIDTKDTVSDAVEKFKLHEKATGKAPEIIALDGAKVAGFMPWYELGLGKRSSKVKNHIKSIRTISHKASHREVMNVFRKHPHAKLVVIDDQDNVIGIIYSDDVLGILKERESASLYGFAGIHKEEDASDSALLKIKFRYKWLILNLFTAFLAAFTVSLFESTLSKYVLLAVYMPIVAGMGGNAGTQTLAVVVRGISLRQITLRNVFSPLMAEVTAGFVNGVINGVLVFGVVMLLNRDFGIALVLALAMVVNLLVAAFFGTLIPLVMRYLGKDPASSATIFITTATDVFGFLAFLGLATLVLA